MKNGLNFIFTRFDGVLILCTALLLAACSREQPQPTEPQVDEPIQDPIVDTITPEQSEAARVALVDWLECEECEENQLAMVLEYSDKLKPLLMSTLQSGAAPASVELYRRELEKRYDELIAYSQDHPNAKPTLAKDEFVDLYLGRFDSQYKSRAAEALGAIGGEDARQAISDALARADSEAMKNSYQEALDSIK